MIKRRLGIVALAGCALLTFAALPADANHSWGGYHWARTSSPFTLGLGNNLTGVWPQYLTQASSDWNQPSKYATVLQTKPMIGGVSQKRCPATTGYVQVCNAAYGYNGWLGVAQIWLSGSHIVQGTVKVNDSYFATSTYDTDSWRQMVMCQEVGHTFGLDHQDETFDNQNLGTCMDYTNNPDGPPSNIAPDDHDYQELAIIYSHLDNTTTVGNTDGDSIVTGGHGKKRSTPEQVGGNSQAEWGQAIRYSSDGRPSLYERDLPNGQRMFTFVIWTR